MARPRGRSERLREAQRHRHARPRPAAAGASGSACSARASSASPSTAPTTSTARSTTRSRTTPSSTSSCCTRRCRARRSTRSTGRTARCCRRRSAPTPTRTASSASTTGTRASSNGEETEYLLRAFRRDFEVNGPSVTRIARTLLRGWLALEGPPRRARARADRVRDEGPRHGVRGGAVGVREVVRAHERRARRRGCARPACGIEQAFGWKARLAARHRRPGGARARSGSRSGACATAGRTSPRRSTRRTRPRSAGPRSRRSGPCPVAGSTSARSSSRRRSGRLIGCSLLAPAQPARQPVLSSVFEAASWRAARSCS